MNLIKLLTILYLVPVVMLFATQKIVYQKDVSEYCRRRVLPSIFLARNAIESTSVILHFSRVELPYSCAISVRTESGCNIIMVSKFNPRTGLADSCAVNSPELVVYEMGETFGGYWGQLSERVVISQEPQPKQFYTLKTTQSISTRETVVNITVPTTLKKLTKKATKKKENREDESIDDDGAIKVDVPIVNVYGRFEPDPNKKNVPYVPEDTDAMFDLRYDVTPEPGKVYHTSIMPLVQFAVKKLVTVDVDGRREEDSDEPRFDLDIVEQFTPDKRLTTRHFASTKRLRFRKFRGKMTSNRRMYFRKDTIKGKLQTTQFKSYMRDYIFPTTKAITSNVVSTHWKTLEEIMNKLNNTSEEEENIETLMKDAALEKIADMKHNDSIYLKPNLTAYLNSVRSTTFTTKTKTIKYKTIRNTSPIIKKISRKVFTPLRTELDSVSISTTTLQSVLSKINENFNLTSMESIVTDSTHNNNLEQTTTHTTQKPSKSLVDHESWENVVQAVPDMAVLLNVTDKIKRNLNDQTTISMDMEKRYKEKKSNKRKRDIDAIDIENARPYNLTTRYMTECTTERDFLLADMQEFPQLVELQDDDLYGRIALRYMRQYVGPVVFNICEFTHTTKKQHVHLFNASRIVITINNFTHLTGLSLVLTTARALLSGDVRCPGTNIECQVQGARVCIDSMAACDGVPNCGSYDVYDEDRLMCGAAEGFQHNVYIAAFTFLAVLLTLLYAVHYWLKRCVPKVADAFFIYTNGGENILYLQPLMRSPHDTGDDTKLFYHPNLFENDFDQFNVPKRNLSRRIFRRFLNILCCGLCYKRSNEMTETDKEDNLTLDFKKVYSFTQNEIQKMFDTTGIKEIQSRDSVQIQKMGKRKRIPSDDSEGGSNIRINDSVLTLEDPFPEDYTDELGMLKFFKDNKKLSLVSKSSSESKIKMINEDRSSSIKTDGETEIYNYSYSATTSEPGPSNERTKTRQSTTRRLRFDEITTQIPASIIEVDEDIIEEVTKEPKHKFLDAMLGRQRNLEEDNDIPSKDHKRLKIGHKKTTKIQNRNLQR